MSISQSILNELKNLNINLDISPVKLKSVYSIFFYLFQGSGDQVVFILDALAGLALEAKKFNYSKKPKFESSGKVEDEPQVDEEGDPNMDMGEMLDDSEGDDVDEILD